MTTNNTVSSRNITTKIAGITYIIIIALGVFSGNFLKSRLISPGNIAATIGNINSHELLFRMSIASELLMYILVIVLSVSLYILLKNVHKNFALAALLFRFGEAIVGIGVTIISGLIPLLILHNNAGSENGQLHSLVITFLNVSTAGLDIVLTLVGIGGIVFFYLFYTSRYIPRLLAAWGIFTYCTMLILGFASMLIPNLPDAIRMALYAPGGVFELVVGFWLLVKGVNAE